MTVAICLRCGERKVGALVVCAKCTFDPHVSPIDSARSILLSDHHMDDAALTAAARLIASGGDPTFDDAKVQEMARAIRDVGGVPIGCLVLTWTPIVVMVGLIVALVAMWLQR